MRFSEKLSVFHICGKTLFNSGECHVEKNKNHENKVLIFTKL